MNKYISRALKSIPCVIITILILPLIIMSQMGPIGNEPGGKANHKVELGLIDWIVKLWTWAWVQEIANKEDATHEWNWETGEGDKCVKCGDKDWFAGPDCSESKLNK